MKKLEGEKLEVVSRHRGGRVELVNKRGEMRVVETMPRLLKSFSISAAAKIEQMTEERLKRLREERLEL